MGNVRDLRKPLHSTVGDLARRLDRGPVRRFLCRLFRRHRQGAPALSVVGHVTPQGFRTRELVVCRYCGKAWAGKEVK